ncbi:hypothetical protein [Streptomyces hoynatensis]|uniref:Guanylate cyclase domain-containing protein n=1 Tax=Streptomyces hoynatensis TaxID=1141874 RepID=A0A3A9Z591_9ACTN|nr:hypothetical protein [Streptomyces hoynatensis]RKN43024.1 hypothetical protein D7294_10955 [Streptomyces hoynatensis]
MSTPLPPSIPVPNAVSRPLPGYRALLAVDAKDFTGLAAIQHSAVSMVITELVDRALTEAGLAELKDAKSFPASTGDGLVFGFDPSWLPFVVFPFFRVLDGLLGRHNGQFVTSRLRLRASVHVGPLPEADGNGTARNDTHRLLDSRPVKAILAAPGSEQTTHLAAILSHRVYEDVVLGGYTGLDPDHFIEVPATVEGKQFAQRAWLYIPSPSGHLLRHGIVAALGEERPAEAADRETEPAERKAGRATRKPGRAAAKRPRPRREISQRVGQGNAIGGDVSGNVSNTFGAPEYDDPEEDL